MQTRTCTPQLQRGRGNGSYMKNNYCRQHLLPYITILEFEITVLPKLNYLDPLCSLTVSLGVLKNLGANSVLYKHQRQNPAQTFLCFV